MKKLISALFVSLTMASAANEADTVATTGGVTADNAKVTAVDIVADNGMIHVIDSVVLPK